MPMIIAFIIMSIIASYTFFSQFISRSYTFNFSPLSIQFPRLPLCCVYVLGKQHSMSCFTSWHFMFSKFYKEVFTAKGRKEVVEVLRQTNKRSCVASKLFPLLSLNPSSCVAWSMKSMMLFRLLLSLACLLLLPLLKQDEEKLFASCLVYNKSCMNTSIIWLNRKLKIMQDVVWIRGCIFYSLRLLVSLSLMWMNLHEWIAVHKTSFHFFTCFILERHSLMFKMF